MVARRAHNPKVVGSNPAPATTFQNTAYAVFFITLIALMTQPAGHILSGGLWFSDGHMINTHSKTA